MMSADPEWFADEALWEAIAPMMVSPEVRAAATADVDAVCLLAAMPRGRVLDLCCGPGRHSVSFARRGFEVTAVDRSPYLLGQGREYADAEGVDVRWVQADMREFVEPESCDLAVSLFTSFGYFDDAADNQLVLERVHTTLVRGGIFVIDVTGKETVARIFQPAGVQELPGGTLLVQRRWVVDDWARIENEWSVLHEGTVRTFRFRHWVYSGVELRDMLKRAGFANVNIFGGLDGSSYGTAAKRLVARATKS